MEEKTQQLSAALHTTNLGLCAQLQPSFYYCNLKNVFILKNFKGLILESISLLANSQIVSSAIVD